MASRYDDELWELVSADRGPPPDHVLRFVRRLGRVESALDLGCGDGRLTVEIDATHVTAADVSRLALDRARHRLAGYPADIVELEPDEPLPLEDSAVDLVLCMETLEHVRDVQLLLSEARRVLRPDGRLAIATPEHGRATGMDILVRGFEHCFDPLSPHLRFFTRGSLARVLDALGFRTATVQRERGTLMVVAWR